LKREEVIGRKRFTDVLAPDSLKDFAEHFCQLKEQKDGQSSSEIELKVVKSDGQILPVLMSSGELHDEAGNFITCRSTLIDISRLDSALEALRRSEEFFRLSVRNVQDYAIFALDTDGRIVSWNEGAQRIKGYTADEIIGSHFSRFYPQADIDAGKPEYELREVIKNGRFEDEGWRLKKDGSRFWANVIITALRDDNGNLRGFGKVTRDITERKALEDSLRAARDQAIDASRFKSEFLATMSHEIRTPMNGIIGMTNILQRTDLNAQQREYLNVVRDASIFLMSIINDILDFSKVEAGKVNLESLEFDPVAVVESVGDLLSAQARQQKVSFMTFVSPEIPPLLLGDPGRLRQVLMNLTSNAIKFSPHGSVVSKALLSSLTEHELVLRFEVSDTGVGISEQQQARLFQPFVQADGTTSRKYGGTGLGLAISKSLVELMGGSIGLESELGKGSTFWFNVPLRIAGQDTIPSSRSNKPDLSGLRVLVVDDEPLARDVIHNYVTSWGMRNGMASNAADALSLLRRAHAENDRYDLLIVDLVMEGKDGIDLAQDVLRDARLRDTKMILITAMDAPGIAEQSIEHGFSGYLRKPVRQSQLMDCIATVMRRTSEPMFANRVTTWKPESYQVSKTNIPLLDTTKTVLVVEDNRVNQQVALLQLKQLGLTADAVDNGREALEALERVPYSVVLMDCQMPELDGFTTTRLIRLLENRTNRKHTPIIAMTAQAMEGDRERCLAAGMDDYVSKPIDERRLALVLARWIPSRGPEGEGMAYPGGSEPRKPELHDINRSLLDYGFLSREFGSHQAVALLSLFKKSSTGFRPNLEAALEKIDTNRVKLLLHELKGSAAALKAERVSSLTAQLEEILNDADDERFKKMLPELLDALDKTLKTIDEIIESHHEL
jgi:PAS domain S-box-containing protein